MRYFLYLVFISLFFSNTGNSTSKIENLIYQLLNSEEIDNYWHAEEQKAKIPVVVLLPRSVAMEDVKLRRSGQYVIFTHNPLSYKNLFIVKKINEENKEKTISFSYGREGISGMATYKKNGNSWVLKKINIVES